MSVCYICNVLLDKDDLVRLDCSHEYHYDCIRNWYKITCSPAIYGYIHTYPGIRECPYCRVSGGYLELRPGEKWDRDLHSRSQKPDPRLTIDTARCQAITQKGYQCTMWPAEGLKYCERFHKKCN